MRLRESEILDILAIELANDPNSLGLIAVSFTDRTSRKQAETRLKRNFNYLTNHRGTEAGRILLAIFPANEAPQTTLYIIPAGADFPEFPEQHEIIKSEDLTLKPSATKPKQKKQR